jgi:hypothetical protein
MGFTPTARDPKSHPAPRVGASEELALIGEEHTSRHKPRLSMGLAEMEKAEN